MRAGNPCAIIIPSDVPDPYFDGRFEAVYRLVEAGCRGLLARVRADQRL
jgi:protein-tyrosine phosphatase